MVNVCKEICVRFKAKEFKGRYRYESGQKLCPICTEFLAYLGVRCPCCSVKLRSTPRGNKSRKEIHEKRKCVWH